MPQQQQQQQQQPSLHELSTTATGNKVIRSRVQKSLFRNPQEEEEEVKRRPILDLSATAAS